MIFTSSKTATIQASAGLRLLLIALAATVVFHGGLIPLTHGKTYDAFIHMFFGDHYHRSWFDPWEPRWYTGFVTVSYPPGTHMMIAGLMHLMPLRAAFVVVQLAGLLLLVIGTYRFSLLWVTPRAAGYAALFVVLASSISETVHVFGQLPTIFSLGIFLNGLPYFFRWIVFGNLRDLSFAVALSAATTAAHHVTSIFGGVLFVLPLAAQSLRAYAGRDLPHGWSTGVIRFWRPLARGILLAVLMITAVALTVFPYWYWSVTDPITQVSIPHGSRESFLERTDLGIVFFLIPWGVSLLVLPYAFYKASVTSLWPLGISLALCFVLGTGGTTPIPRAILGGAFDILTLDRFTFWGSILILPFTGVMLDGLMHGRSREAIRAVLGVTGHRALIGGFFLASAGFTSFVAILTSIQPTQPRFVDPTPIVQFMQEDEHDRWRYLTLGFGDQFAYLSAQMTAQSVDGNYHSARRLPDLTRFSVERLENAKYLGVPGLGSLQQFIVNADRYHLKYIFSNDEFYDPLLHFNGWNRLNRLGNGIVVWEKPDVTPLPLYLPRRSVPVTHAVIWGAVPPFVLALAFALLIWDLARGRSVPMPVSVVAPRAGFSNPRRVRRILISLALIGVSALAALSYSTYQTWVQPRSPEQVLRDYYEHLDFRRFEQAYDLLDPEFRPSYDDMLFRWKWQGGLLNSYGKLEDLTMRAEKRNSALIDFDVSLTYLTSLSRIEKRREMRLVQRDGLWRIAPTGLQHVQVPVRLQRQPAVDWNTVGRRQPRADADLHRDRLDRNRIALMGARVVRHAGRYSIVGQVTNSDHDPAAVSIFGTLFNNDETLAQKAAGQWGGQRLLPAESTGFRVEFDGVLSLRDAQSLGTFDPKQFLPPEFNAKPTGGALEARALVNTNNLYRGVTLNGLRFEQQESALNLSGLAVNTGTETATIIRINVLLFGPSGRPLWVDAGFVETNLYPGQSTEFSLAFPQARAIEIVADLDERRMLINGASQQTDVGVPQAGNGTVPLHGLSGYTAARIHVTTMTHQPLF
ncbi:hypothetical protein ACXYMO_10000 [Arenibacterium sp. CAU 1754]